MLPCPSLFALMTRLAATLSLPLTVDILLWLGREGSLTVSPCNFMAYTVTECERALVRADIATTALDILLQEPTLASARWVGIASVSELQRLASVRLAPSLLPCDDQGSLAGCPLVAPAWRVNPTGRVRRKPNSRSSVRRSVMHALRSAGQLSAYLRRRAECGPRRRFTLSPQSSRNLLDLRCVAIQGRAAVIWSAREKSHPKRRTVHG